jgi:hypothetical protein
MASWFYLVDSVPVFNSSSIASMCVSLAFDSTMGFICWVEAVLTYHLYGLESQSTKRCIWLVGNYLAREMLGNLL